MKASWARNKLVHVCTGFSARIQVVVHERGFLRGVKEDYRSYVHMQGYMGWKGRNFINTIDNGCQILTLLHRDRTPAYRVNKALFSVPQIP